MEEVLVVIDMQPYFVDCILQKRIEPLITNIQRELRRSISLRQWILLLEYKDCGETDPRITACLKHYSRFAILCKEDDCGSGEVLNELQRRQPYPDLRVAGINTHACVLKTVQGLSTRLWEQQSSSLIRVVADACDTSSGPKWHQDALSKMRRLPNVEVL